MAHEINLQHIEQALKDNNLDYFYQAMLKPHQIKWILLKISSLGGDEQLTRYLIKLFREHELDDIWFHQYFYRAISNQKYKIAQLLLEAKPDSNIFHYYNIAEIRQNRIFKSVFELAFHDKITKNQGLTLFETIIASLPHEHTIIYEQYKCRHEHDMKSYRFIYNELLSQFLWAVVQPLSEKLGKKNNQKNFHQAIVILAKKNFTLNESNKMLIKRGKLEPVFSDVNRNYNNVNININRLNTVDWRKTQNQIKNNEGEIIRKGLAHRTILSTIKDEPVFWNNRKLAIYAELAQHFHTPESLDETMYEVFYNSKRTRRMPTDEEYAFLKQFENSTKNHQRLLQFFNRFVYYDRRHLHDRLNETLQLDMESGLFNEHEVFSKI
jgi:hypothetical protein